MFFSGIKTFDFAEEPQFSKWKKSDFLIACLLWMTQSFFAVPLHLVIPACITAFLILAMQKRVVLRSQFWGFVLVFVLSMLNMLIGMSCFNIFPESVAYYIPRLLFFPMIFLLGCSLSPQTVKYFIYLLFIEFCFALLQRFNLFPVFATTEANLDAAQLYLQRTPGFSYGYGSLGFRFYFIILLFFAFYEKYHALMFNRWLFLAGITIGLIVSFNRTSFIALPFFFMFYFLRIRRIKKYLTPKVLMLLIAAFIAFLIMLPTMFEFVQKEVLLDADDFNKISSSRGDIYAAAWDFIKENPVFGTFSNRYHDQSPRGVDHAHNSYLQCMADHGIPIFLLVMAIYISMVNRENFPYIISIAMFCMLNYLAFWGCSDYDALIFYLLTQLQPCKKEKLGEEADNSDQPPKIQEI